MRSLYSAVSGLKAHQTAMDVIGNNISNVNTTGYKSSSITFQELFSQTLQGATSAQDNTGGSNAIQIGLGVSVGSTNYNMESGIIESSNGVLDAALDGDGYFIVSDGSQNYYTRAGSFSYDGEGNITYGNDGYYVQGWQADEDGKINTNIQAGNIYLDRSMDPSATTYCNFTGNINSTLENILKLQTSEIDIKDTNGDTDTISVELTEGSAYNTWEYTLTAGDSSSVFEINNHPSTGSISGEIVLNNDGTVSSFTTDAGDDLLSNALTLSIGGSGPAVTIANHTASFDTSTTALFEDAAGTKESITADYEFDSTAKLTAEVYDSQGNSHTLYLYADQVADNTWEINSSDVDLTDASNVSLDSNTITLVFDDDGKLVSGDELELSFTPDGLSSTQTISVDLSEMSQHADDTDLTAVYDGYTAGSLNDISYSDTGELVGSYSNGYSKIIAQLAIGDFANPSGLLKVGDTLFQESVNSGDVIISTAGSGGTGAIKSSSLEASNVDISEQFSNMIKIQRGYQANSTVITTSDEMLETLVNMKR